MSWRCLLVVTLASTMTPGAQPSYSVASTDRSRSALLEAGAAEWTSAASVTWGPAPYETTFRAMWSTEGLYLRFDAADDHPWHTMTKRDDHLWEEEVVEIFLDINRSGRDYAELEISPGNVVCDVRMVEPWPNKQMEFSWDIEGLETRVLPAPGRSSGP